MQYVIFGESHGPAVGVVLTGVMPGLDLDLDFISAELARRAPGSSPLSTPRKEEDRVSILSGIYRGKTAGTPVCAMPHGPGFIPRKRMRFGELAKRVTYSACGTRA